MSQQAEDYEFSYVYAPGRSSQRQHCFTIFGRAGTAAQRVYVSGYGPSRLSALKDLREDVAMSVPAVSDWVVQTLYHRWQKAQEAP